MSSASSVVTNLMSSGATVVGSQVGFRVWAPAAHSVRLRFEDGRSFPLEAGEHGVFGAVIPAWAGQRYFYQRDEGRPLPDPVSRLLPEGVHGPTEIVDPNGFPWTDQKWRSLPLRDYVIYELRTGTFSPEGTFAGVMERLEYLKQLGITVIELMPVAAFPGASLPATLPAGWNRILGNRKDDYAVEVCVREQGSTSMPGAG